MKRYEHSIRVMTGLFSVLLGFGLKKLLDATAATAGGTFTPAGAAWPCFVMSLFLFLRFLMGSNNHLWAVYVRPDLQGSVPFKAPRSSIIRDFLFVVVFGVIGMSICYAKTVREFLLLNLVFTVAGFVWVAVGVVWRFIRVRGPGDPLLDEWDFWWWINLVQSGAVGAVYLIDPDALGPWLWALAASYLVLLVFDLREQLKRLERV